MGVPGLVGPDLVVLKAGVVLGLLKRLFEVPAGAGGSGWVGQGGAAGAVRAGADRQPPPRPRRCNRLRTVPRPMLKAVATWSYDTSGNPRFRPDMLLNRRIAYPP